MSCDGRRRKLLKQLLGPHATSADVQALEAQFKAACGSLDDDDNASVYRSKTEAMLMLCDRYDVPRPVHGTSGLPKRRTHRGYALLFDALSTRGVLGQPTPSDAPAINAKAVPEWAIVEEACGCRAMRVPPPPKSPSYPYFMRVSLGTQAACDHGDAPIGYIGWCFDDGFRIVDQPPARRATGPVFEPIPEGMFADLDETLRVLRDHPDATQRGYDLAYLARQEPIERRQALLSESLVHFGVTSDTGIGSRAAHVVGQVAEELAADGDLASALFMVRAIKRSYPRAAALGRLAAARPPDQRRPLIDEALVIADNDYDGDTIRKSMVTSLVYEAKDADLALMVAATIDQPAVQAESLTFCAKHLPEAALPAVLVAGRNIGQDHGWGWQQSHDDCAQVLASLAPRVSGAERAGIVAEVLDLAERGGHWYTVVDAVATVAPYMSPDQLQRALAICDDVGKPAPSADGRSDDRGPDARTRGYTKLLPYLPAKTRAAAIAEALRSAYALPDRGGYNMTMRPRALARLMPYLTADQREQAWTTVLDSLPVVHESWERAELLTHVAPYLDTLQRQAARAAAQAHLKPHDLQQVVEALTDVEGATEG